MWKNLSTREKRLVFFTVAVVLAAAAYRMVFLPELSALWGLEEQSENTSLKLLEMERALALGERIDRQYKDYEATISQQGTDLEESTAFLKTVSDITKANEMKVLSQELLPTEPSIHYKIFSVRLGVKTRPIWLARFIASLERGKDLIRVEDVAIKSLDDSENLSVNMKLTKVVAAEKAGKP